MKIRYLFWAIVCICAAWTGLFGDMGDTSIGTRIVVALIFIVAAIYLFGKFKGGANTSESSQEAPSDAAATQTAKTADTERGNVAEADYDDYVAIDIETTGLGRSARIIELGAVRMRHGRKVASFSQLVNPQIPIPAKVTQITGITDRDVYGAPSEAEAVRAFLDFVGALPLVAHNAAFYIGFITARDVKGKPTIDKALPKFYAFCGHDTWIGHNIRRFDLPVIAREAERVGAGMPDVSFYDTLEVSQTLLPQLDRHRLLDLIRYFGIAKTERHRAADDAAQTAQVFERLKRV